MRNLGEIWGFIRTPRSVFQYQSRLPKFFKAIFIFLFSSAAVTIIFVFLQLSAVKSIFLPPSIFTASIFSFNFKELLCKISRIFWNVMVSIEVFLFPLSHLDIRLCWRRWRKTPIPYFFWFLSWCVSFSASPRGKSSARQYLVAHLARVPLALWQNTRGGGAEGGTQATLIG